MKAVLTTFLLALSLLGCTDRQAVSDFELLAPRPFGYVIGDEIQHRLLLETRNGVKLQAGSLPSQGALNRWLNLNRITVKESRAGSGFRYTIDLSYQVFYAPNEVKMLTIPGFNLTLGQGDKTAEQAVPAWNFTLSPLRELAVRKDDSGEYKRPDAMPPMLSTGGPVLALLIAGLGALSSAAGLAFLYGYLPGMPRRSIFKRASVKLARLSGQELELGLTIFHDALNALNRQPLFKHKLAGFFRQHPQYRSVGEQLEWFFNCSNSYFFVGAAESGPETLDRLKKLCADCREIERGGQ
ncbi:MAG: nonribosomal peptide synthetase MxaA [Methylobacter sp.]